MITQLAKKCISYKMLMKKTFLLLAVCSLLNLLVFVVDKTEYSRLQFKDNAVNVVKP